MKRRWWADFMYKNESINVSRFYVSELQNAYTRIFFDARYNDIMAEVVNELEKFVIQLKREFPQFRFRAGKKFTFRPPRTIIYENYLTVVDNLDDAELSNNYKLQLLHEVGHALLEHKSFPTDVERLRMECAAWEQARELSTKFNLKYNDEFVEAALDTYRDWLHSKARCPECGLTRYQTKDGRYHCPGCEVD